MVLRGIVVVDGSGGTPEFRFFQRPSRTASSS